MSKTKWIKIQVPKSGWDFHARQRFEECNKAFCLKHHCYKCGSIKDIEIHHLYEYAPKELIETYEDFLLIPWIPLCRKCHNKVEGIT